jgi:hypothetical protein
MDLLKEPLKYIYIFPIDSTSSGFPMEKKRIIFSKSKDMIQILCMYPSFWYGEILPMRNCIDYWSIDTA